MSDVGAGRAGSEDPDLARFYGVNIARDCIQEAFGVRTRRRGEYVAAARLLEASDVALQRVLTELERRAAAGRLGGREAFAAFVDEFVPDVPADSPSRRLLHGLDLGSQTYGGMYDR